MLHAQGSSTGAVYLFSIDDITDSWSQQQLLLPEIDSAEYYGFSVVFSPAGDTLAIGASHQGKFWIQSRQFSVDTF